jgi:very-short-patch-repair endonuclease
MRVGRLHGVLRGVYSLSPPNTLRREGHWMAAVLAFGPEAVLSHASAAALWDLRRSSAGVVDVTVPGPGGRARRRGIRLHRSVTLTDDQRTIHHGIPVTTIARTLIDLADRYDRRTAERATDQAEVLTLFDLIKIRAAIEANPGRRGAAVMRRLLDEYEIGVGLTESELEDEFLRLCARYRIPRPDLQERLGPGRVDFIWRDQRLVVEVDSWRWHGGRNKWESDQRRDIRLQRDGFRVARFSYLRVVREPESVAEDLRALLSAAPSAALRRAG